MSRFFLITKSILLNIILFLSFPIYGQVEKKIQVIDFESKKSIPYVTIRVLNDSVGLYSNGNGEFSKFQILDKKVQISSIGYFTKIVKINKEDKSIFLQPKTYDIEEVTIKPRRTNKIKIGYVKYKHLNSVSVSHKSGTELAVLVRNKSKKSALINKIFIDAKIKNMPVKYRFDFISVFKINIYTIKDKNKVGDLLNDNSLAFTSKDLKGNTTIDFAKYNIEMPPEGAFISIEWVGKLNEKTNEIKLVNHGIEPMVGYTSKPGNIEVYKRNKLTDDKWTKYDEKDKLLRHINSDKYIPKIAAELVY